MTREAAIKIIRQKGNEGYITHLTALKALYMAGEEIPDEVVPLFYSKPRNRDIQIYCGSEQYEMLQKALKEDLENLLKNKKPK